MSCFETDKFIFVYSIWHIFWRAHVLQFLFRALFVVLRAVEVHFGLILLRVWGLILSRILQIYSIIVRFYMITFFGMKFQIFSSIESCDVSSFMSHAFVAEIIWEHFQDWVQNLKNVRIYFFRATLKYHKISHNCPSKKLLVTYL